MNVLGPWLLSSCLIMMMMGPPPLSVSDCVYTPRLTRSNPYPEPTRFADCAVRLASGGIEINQEHLESASYATNGLAAFWIDGHHYWVKPNGEHLQVVTLDNGPDPFSEGLTRTIVDCRVAFADESLRRVIEPGYDWAWPFENGRALVCRGCTKHREPGEEHTSVTGGEWGYIDHDGNEVVPVKYPRDQLPPQSPAQESEE